MAKKNDRVGAILGGKNGKIEFLGYGIYQGEEIPPKGISMFGIDLAEMGLSNPKILLDNGDVVWGCQCWWGSEERVKKQLEGKEVINITIGEALKEMEK